MESDKKLQKTILYGGVTYALVNRFRKALPTEILKDLEQTEEVSMIDGRGLTHTIHQGVIDAAREFGMKILVTYSSASLKHKIEVIDGKITFNPEGKKRGRPRKK
jgi:lysophospholipid acyltransferase (LPLAT)-like uncharacterized protein